ncbi:MAG: tryptophan 7-halogenase [Pseudomonadales bacterium]|nr:tryptophan 7-halogenase [Pseudomonadales bacterium]
MSSGAASQQKKIVIVGGGTAGWMAANLMAQQWRPDQVAVQVIESPDIGIIGVGEGSTPSLKRFFEILGIPEKAWMPRCNATYKVNIQFNGWSPASGIESYSHPFISQTDTFTTRPFHVNCLTRRLGLDVHTAPEDFLLNGMLAKAGKAPVAGYGFPFVVEYGYHFDSALLGQFLAEEAVKRGVTHTQARVVDVLLGQAGDIESLACEDGESVTGDLFIDCTGFRSLLLQQKLGVEFHSFAENLFNDAAVVLPTGVIDPLPVQTESTALSAGWCWQIPLTHRTGNGYVYSSRYISPEAAEQELREHLGLLDADVEARHLKMKVGQVAEHWHRNCIALGLSQGFIEPLEATALHLVQISVESFIEIFEKGNFTDAGRDEYNQRVSTNFDHVRNYIVAHYKLNTRNDSDYWRANRESAISESLAQLLDVWYRRGDIVQEINRQGIGGHFSVTSWHCLLAGYGAFPPLAEQQPGQGDLYQEHQIAEFMSRCGVNFQSNSQVMNDFQD